ncbi:hypothetical protein CfE428DRAFT_6602 [Chthoniobacter flavus Ellin428]|uniref:Uncharacterized protein n=1 Tax=Chthoniobacter flavus Ellin428 TaxID=497964 RepID=B4DCG1_9BACT|nr:hypothetical protein [Chthoniobacter flavus]EDY15870.1 hypothetical protein CfE428DRAFT_6602 [Chthoniobacter flavus Ellin428]TCO82213.1 hypothetical protein EV701_14810 [Chthoniobacter flavus]
MVHPPAGAEYLNHFGLRVQDSETLAGIQRGPELASLHTKREEGVRYGYARQITGK